MPKMRGRSKDRQLSEAMLSELPSPSQRRKMEALRDLCAGDQPLFEAMQEFLLFQPKIQLSSIRDVSALVARAERAEKEGHPLEAKADFETAAKFSIYRQDESETRRLLDRADRVTKGKREHAMHETILDNLEEALMIARKHYEKR